MKKTPFLLALSLLAAIYCQLPTDPLQDYNACTVTIDNISDNKVFLTGDTVDLKLAMDRPHLIDSIAISFNKTDTIIKSTFATGMSDTLHLKRLFTDADSIKITIITFKRNGLNDTNSLNIIIKGHEPEFTSNLKSLFVLEPGFACTLSVKATGSAPLLYQWFKNDAKLASDTLDTLILPYAQPSDSGEYYCEVSNRWAAKKSSKASVVIKDASDKKAHWTFGIFKDTLSEGETLLVRIDSLYVAPSADTVTLSLLTTSAKTRFIGDSLFVFVAGKRDSGEYYLPVSMAATSGADTGVITITVLPRYCTLSIKADSGSVTIKPQALSYRWGDTVTLTAVPDKGFKFFKWSGDASGSSAELKTAILKNSAITALFIVESASGCTELSSGSLNKAIKEASPSSQRPGALCPAAGLYDNGTIKVLGTVRFTFQ